MAELTQDQVLAQLRTRGFEEGFQRTPLRDFWGILTSIGGDMRDGDRGPYLVILYNYGEVEVIETIEPYTSPIAQVEITASSKARSAMGYWGASLDRVINAGVPPEVLQEQVKNQDSLVGKKLHLKLTPGHMVPRKQGDQWENIAIDCWELLEVAGEGAPAPTVAPTPAPAANTGARVEAAPAPVPTPTPAAPVVSAAQQALKLLHGKNDQQWHQSVFVDPVVKADAGIVKSIIDKTFLPPMIEMGVVTKDDTTGIYTVDMTKIPA